MANIVLTQDDIQKLASQLSMTSSKLLTLIYPDKENKEIAHPIEQTTSVDSRPVVDLRLVSISKILAVSTSKDVSTFLKVIVANTKSSEESKVSRKKMTAALGLNEMQLVGIASGLSRAVKKVCQGQRYYLHGTFDEDGEMYYHLLGITYEDRERRRILDASIFESNLGILRKYFQI
jgi:hypothetical protein